MPILKYNSVLFTLLLCFLVVTSAAALSPPWFVQWNKVLVSVGADDGVQVDALDTTASPYVITVHVSDPVKAQAMASILIPQYSFGNVQVSVRVLDASGTMVQPAALGSLQDLLNATNAALASNKLFVGAFPANTGLPVPQVGALFARVVVQFFDDDISEPHSNYNATAASVFGDVLTLSYGGFNLLLGTQKPGAIPQLIAQPM